MDNFDLKKYLIENRIKEELSVDSILFKLKESFMPAFEEFVEVNLIEKLENSNTYSKQEIDFARQLKDVLKKLKHGEI